MTTEEFVEFLRERAVQYWNGGGRAYFVADIPRDLLSSKSIDYRTILGEKRLKAFIEEQTGADSFKLVKHPSQHAKIAIVPPEADFSFIEEKDDAITTEGKHFRSRQRTVLDFLELVLELPIEDQREISVPVRILAKLIREK